MIHFDRWALGALCALAAASAAQANEAGRARYADAMRELAARHDVPERLIHRIIMRESRYQPHLVSKGNYGLMQIKPATARGMGYRGSPAGLLDGRTNLTYAVPYLANAWRIAGRNEDGAVRLYAGGYYYVAKRKGMLGQLQTAHAPRSAVQADASAQAKTVAAYAPEPRDQPGLFSFLFGGARQPQQVAAAEPAAADESEPAVEAPRAKRARANARSPHR